METKNESLPEMEYEHLARDVFKVEKARDPWGYAYAEFYEGNINKLNFEGKRALSTILIKMIFENKDSTLLDTLKNLENDVWRAKDQSEMNRIIVEAIKIYDIIIHQS